MTSDCTLTPVSNGCVGRAGVSPATADASPCIHQVAMTEKELQKLGEAGKDRRVEKEEAEIQELRRKHHVS